MSDGLEREYFRQNNSRKDINFPAVNIEGDRIRKNYGLNGGQDVTKHFYKIKDSGKTQGGLADVSYYDIKDYGLPKARKKTSDDLEDTKRKLEGKRQSIVLGSTLNRIYKPPKKTPISILEQSQSYRGLRTHISVRLRESPDHLHRQKDDCIKPRVPPKDIRPRILTSSTVFLKTRGIHVHVTQSSKEALIKEMSQRKYPKKTSRVSSSNSKHSTKESEFLVTGVVSASTNEDEIKRSEISSYAIRQQYGQHLEKNWFKSLVREINSKSKDGGSQNEYPFTRDMFYSPEPNSDENDEDTTSIYNGIRSITCDLRESQTDLFDISPRSGENFGDLKLASSKFSSMDVLVSEEDSEDVSDIELVLKNGQLIEKRVRNKMLKKRERQLLRFQQFATNSEAVSEEEEEVDIKNMSDKELRAMRLKLKKRKWKPKLRGIARFRQFVKSLQVLLYFSRKLKDIRKRRRAFKKRSTRHRSLGGFDSENDDGYARFLRNQNRYKSLKDMFLGEIGWKLVRDVANLCIKDGFGYDIRDELASGERRSRYQRVLLEWFPPQEEENEREDGAPMTRFTVKQPRALKRSSSCPELIKGKEFRVLIGGLNETRDNKSKNSKRKSSIKPQKGLLKSKNRDSNSRKKTVTYGSINEQDDEDNAIGHHRFERRNSLTMDDNTKSGRLDLRDLLRDVHIPAKEIKIQIAERKLRRNKRVRQSSTSVKKDRSRDAKDSIEADRFKIPEFYLPDFASTSPDEASEHVAIFVNEEERVNSEDAIYSSFSVRNCHYVSSGVSWNKPKSTQKETWSKEELDIEIEKAGSLFLEMRHCRYIRWNRLTQAMVDRMMELETEAF